MAKYIKSAPFPVPPIGTKIIGTKDGLTSTLIELTKVEEHVSDGTYRDYVMVSVKNDNLTDVFLFDVDQDYQIDRNYITSNESSMNLLTLYMMAIQSNYNLNEFIVELVKKFKSDFGYSDVVMVNNKKGAIN